MTPATELRREEAISLRPLQALGGLCQPLRNIRICGIPCARGAFRGTSGSPLIAWLPVHRERGACLGASESGVVLDWAQFPPGKRGVHCLRSLAKFTSSNQTTETHIF